jgi:hypothetical protein
MKKYTKEGVTNLKSIFLISMHTSGDMGETTHMISLKALLVSKKQTIG